MKVAFNEKLLAKEWHRRNLDWVGRKLGVVKQEDWYTVSARALREAFGNKLLKKEQNHSLYVTLRTVYPEFEWNPIHFNVVPGKFWREHTNQRFLMDCVAEELGIEVQQDWYTITIANVKALGAEPIMKRYHNSSLYSTLCTLYPEFQWDPLQFAGTPKQFRTQKKIKQQREIMDKVADRLGIQKQQDWYKHSAGDIFQCTKSNFISDEYNNSIYRALQSIYPEFSWSPFLFQNVPRRYWREPNNRRQYFDWLAENLGIKTQEDWYNCTSQAMKNHGAHTLLEGVYYDSLYSALAAVYPEYNWNPLMFQKPPRNSFDTKFIKDVLDTMIDTLQPGEWHRVNSYREFRKISRKYGGRLNTLEKFYPEVNWARHFSASGGEVMLENMLRTLGTLEKQKRIRNHSIDFYLPKYSLAFEFQGDQHYKQHYRGLLSSQMDRDLRKRQDLTDMGITLVEVPHWWNGSFTTLLETIQKYQPGPPSLIHHSLKLMYRVIYRIASVDI